ncbi:MAG: sigma-54 dependent transcriptional regulator [Planctomycetota bacterium]|nr:sigma-54 dependent transcriptional regulator [Planctomycetota bacterium]
MTTRPPGSLDPKLCRRAAKSDCTLLLVGQTGVGKGHLARWLHAHSNRADRPLVPVNCGAIPEHLIDSQLFGHVKGAFTGATNNHLGMIRAAQGGTLLLDEVSELPPSAQNRLLRLLQEREVQPVGHVTPIVVDVRVIASTNADLTERVAEKKFREDLLFRLDVIQLEVKPLIDRPGELPDLLDLFNHEFAALYKQEPIRFQDRAYERLLHFQWPGNVRQLRTLVERLHVLCPDETISVEHLEDFGQLKKLPRPEDARRKLKDMKIEEVMRVIARSGGSIARAAEVCGVHRSTVYRWISRG